MTPVMEPLVWADAAPTRIDSAATTATTSAKLLRIRLGILFSSVSFIRTAYRSGRVLTLRSCTTALATVVGSSVSKRHYETGPLRPRPAAYCGHPSPARIGSSIG